MCARVWCMYMCGYTSTRSGLLTCQFMSQTGKVLLGLIAVMCVCVFPGLCWDPQSTFPSCCSVLEQVVTWIATWIWCELQLDDVCDVVWFLLDVFTPSRAVCTFFPFFFFSFMSYNASERHCMWAKNKKRRGKMPAVTVVFHCYSAFVTFASSSGHSELHLEKHSCLEHRHKMSKCLQAQLGASSVEWNKRRRRNSHLLKNTSALHFHCRHPQTIGVKRLEWRNVLRLVCGY